MTLLPFFLNLPDFSLPTHLFTTFCSCYYFVLGVFLENSWILFFLVDPNSLHGKIQSIYIYCNDLCILFYPFYFTSYLLYIFTSSFIIFTALIALFIVFSFLFANLAVLLFPFLLLKCLLYYYLKTTCNFRIYSSVLWLLLIF